MLVEPPVDATLDALDRALLAALRARIKAGARGSVDAEILALRAQLDKAEAAEIPLLRALLGRVDAATGALVTVWGPAARTLAVDRYGLTVQVAADADAALAAVQEGGRKRGHEGGRALIDLGGSKPWWGQLLARPGLRVTGALPDDRHRHPLALMIETRPSGPTGEDRTFWVSDSPLPDSRIVAALEAAGLVASPLITSGGLKLFMLAGYVQADDPRLTGAPGSLTGIIGAAPVF
ncbi:hypothetical protein [uncultured Brevundimonas sp.]|uniref:hypothetical protein n=1 Tax=uncultured Brevundimonas sp. TaxID=213418 RepID=UPI0030EBCFF2|tara:strand:- start:317 stop:1024 length:708 start_codon:yes stop_codon:yes gene_type:complete